MSGEVSEKRKGMLRDLSGKTKLAERLSQVSLRMEEQSASALEIAYLTKLCSVLTKPNELLTAPFDGNRLDKKKKKEPTLGMLKNRAFSLDFDAFSQVIDAYRNSKFGIVRNGHTDKEAAKLLALFSLTGLKPYLDLHGQSLVDGWFGVIHNPGGGFPESLALKAYGHQNPRANLLLALPPFSDSEITKEKILEGKAGSSDSSE